MLGNDSTLLENKLGGITAEQANNVRARLRWLLDTRFATRAKPHGNKAALGRDLARACGRPAAFTGQALTLLLNGTNGPGWEIVGALAIYLGVPLESALAPFARSGVRVSVPGTMAAPGRGEPRDMGDLVRLPAAIKNARYPDLESAIAYHQYESPPRWSREVVIAARDGFFGAACERWTPPQWDVALDAEEERARAALAPRGVKTPRRLRVAR